MYAYRLLIDSFKVILSLYAYIWDVSFYALFLACMHIIFELWRSPTLFGRIVSISFFFLRFFKTNDLGGKPLKNTLVESRSRYAYFPVH